ncbi:MAG TPA: hypothetical protein VFJ20_00530 [Gemmatimonadaceae bacterium]|nr:hypothetical protein [Gemmatimonadaceae bacterium]
MFSARSTPAPTYIERVARHDVVRARFKAAPQSDHDGSFVRAFFARHLSIAALAILCGHPGWQRRAVFGAAVGFGIALASFHCQQSGCLDGYCPGSKSDLKALVLAGSAGLGAIIAQIGIHERWESVLDRRPPAENLR